MFQFHNFVFTAWDMSKLDEWLALDVQYIIMGKEICPKTKQEHLQGYCELKKKKTMGGIKSMFKDKTMHIEVRKGTQEQAITYCMKDLDFVEAGEKKHQGRRGDLDGYREIAATDGMRAIAAIGNSQHIRVAEKYLEYNEEGRSWKTEVVWLWGASGAGKSRWARVILDGKDTYVKSSSDKWWNGYDAHEAVIIDDFRDSWWSLTEMLRLLDRYECRVEVKGGMRQFKPRWIVITSIKKPEECYQSASGEPIKQLLRRLDETIEIRDSEKPEVEGNTTTSTSTDITQLL